MLRSLWSGVSGLIAHQYALDVEANNLANVNTVGFKYSRASFADMFYQTKQLATAPYGARGGMNEVTVGLGASVIGTTRIHSQGSSQTTDKATDLSINGNGFFVLSADGGKNNRYTRAGDFVWDADGNLVNNEGYVVQGWLKDVAGLDSLCSDWTATKYDVDTTGPIEPIIVKPGMVIPAKPTTGLTIRANLTSGADTKKTACVYALDSTTKTSADYKYIHYDKKGERDQIGVDFGAIYNRAGESLGIREEQGLVISYSKVNFVARLSADSLALGTAYDTASLNGYILMTPPGAAPYFRIEGEITINGTKIVVSNDSASTQRPNNQAILDAINKYRDKTGVFATVDATVLPAENPAGHPPTVIPPAIKFINNNDGGYDLNSKNFVISGTSKGVFKTITKEDSIITAFRYKYSSADLVDKANREFRTTEHLREEMQRNANMVKFGKAVFVKKTACDTGAYPLANRAIASQKDSTGVMGPILFDSSGNRDSAGTFYAVSEHYLTDSNVVHSAAVRASVDPLGLNVIPTTAVTSGFPAAGATAFWFPDRPYVDPGEDQYSVSLTIKKVGGDTSYFLENKNDLDQFGPGSSDDMAIMVTMYADSRIRANERLYKIINGLSSPTFSEGGQAIQSDCLKVPILSYSDQMFDSLGNKQDMQIEFKKKSRMEWEFNITLAEPSRFVEDIVSDRANILQNGRITFNSDGSLGSVTPTSFRYNPNNGSKGPLIVKLDFGVSGSYDAMTMTAQESVVTHHEKDGFESGTLMGTRFDGMGTILGSFSNGQTMALGRVAVSTFTNESGLSSIGGTIFGETANSGDPIIGVAGQGQKGGIKGSTLEMSNVDMSRSMTQLIVLQRGFQINSKSITTSDTILQELINLKR